MKRWHGEWNRLQPRGAVCTNDIDRAHHVSRQLNAGTVWINTYGPTDTRLPLGGMGGQSGIGRDLGRAAL
jgi:aldehyde dehydrogenase (NAD+)